MLELIKTTANKKKRPFCYLDDDTFQYYIFVLHKFLVKLSSREEEEEIAALSDVHMQKDMKVIIDRDRMLLQYTLRRDFQCKIATVLTS